MESVLIAILIFIAAVLFDMALDVAWYQFKQEIKKEDQPRRFRK